jgi:hypothetical protein
MCIGCIGLIASGGEAQNHKADTRMDFSIFLLDWSSRFGRGTSHSFAEIVHGKGKTLEKKDKEEEGLKKFKKWGGNRHFLSKKSPFTSTRRVDGG